MKFMLNIGKAIKEARTTLAINQKDLSKRCNISQSFLSQIENGERKPTIETLEIISKGIGVPVHILTYMATSYDKLDNEKTELSDLVNDTFEFFKKVYFKKLSEIEERKKLQQLEDDKILIQNKIREIQGLKSDFEKLIEDKITISKESQIKLKGGTKVIGTTKSIYSH